jgi:hypothetical protein
LTGKGGAGRNLLARLLPSDSRTGRTLDQADPKLDLRAAWRRDDSGIEADAIAFWERLGILPPGVDPAARAKELVAAAYHRGTLIAVTTASIARYEPLRASFAFLRGAVDPAHRRSLAGTAIAVFARETIEAWAVEHPEAGVAGVAGIVESPDVAARQRAPVWPQTGLNLVGYTPDGRQVRAAWFQHYRID